jgi:predicted phosphodiesterase
MDFNSIVVLGDIHGKFDISDPVARTLKNMERRSLLIQVGDFGLGFHSRAREARMLQHLDRLCDSLDTDVWVIRGNHDDPSYWSDTDKRELFNSRHPRIQLIPDYTYKMLNGSCFLFVGGAISLDRSARAEGVSYWKNEKFILKTDLIEDCADVLITHSCPDFLDPPCKGPLVSHYASQDSSLVEDLKSERKLHTQLLQALPSLKKHFYGHFHKHRFELKGGVRHTCLDIEEAALIV